MKKFIQKIAAMAITSIMAVSSMMPTMAATSQNYVPTVKANDGISPLSVEDYNTATNNVTIKIVDDANRANILEVLDSSVLKSGNMGGIDLSGNTTRTYNGSSYKFSHFEYVTSVRNYVASYNSKFEFYVDPPMEIWAIYTTGTPNPPDGPIVGMYKDPDKKTVEGRDLTFFYLSEAAASGTDLNPSGNTPNITLGRSATDESVSGNSETFSVQAGNIYSANNNNNYQFIVASAIVNGGPINILATANLTTANAQIKTWDFSTTAFDSAANLTKGTDNVSVNGLTFSRIPSNPSSDTEITINGTKYTRGIKQDTGKTLSFAANKGDVIEIYGRGNSNDSVLNIGNATLKSGTGKMAKSTGSLNTYIADSTGNVTVSISTNNGYFYCIKVNPYAISENTDTPVPPITETVNAAVTVNPAEAKININGTAYGNGDTITLNIGGSYTVTSADTSAYTLTSVTPSATFTASASTTSIVANLTAVTVDDQYYDVIGSGDVDSTSGLVYDFQNAAYNGKKAHVSGAQAAGAVYGMVDASDNYLIYSTDNGLTVTDNSSVSNAAYIPLVKTLDSGVVTITGTVKLSSDCTNAINIVRFGASGVGIRYNASGKLILSNGSTYSSDGIAYTVGNDVTFTWVIDITNNTHSLTIDNSTITQNNISAQSSNLLVLNTGSTATFDTSCKNMAIKHAASDIATVTANIVIEPDGAEVIINGSTYGGEDSNTIELVVGNSYTVSSAAPDDFTLNSVTVANTTVTDNTFTANANSDTITVKLTQIPKSGSISGIITDGTNPIIGAIVKLLDSTGIEVSGAGQQTTDENGIYSFVNILFGNYTVQASADGYDDGTYAVSNFNANNADITNANIALSASGSDIPVPSEIIWHKYYAYAADAVTNGDTNDTSFFSGTTTAGNALASTFTIDEQSYNITRRSSSVTPSITFTVPEGYKATLYFAVRSNSGTSKIITVASTDGGTYSKSNNTTATQNDSLELMSFTDMESGAYQLSSSANIQYGFVAVKLESVGPVTTGTINVTVTDQNGNKLPNAAVSCNGVTATTGSDGTTALAKVTAGSNLIVTATKDGDSGTNNVSLTAGSSADVTVVITLTTGTIRAVVTSDGTTPITGAMVTAVNNGITYNLVATSTDGVYELSGVPAGSYTVTATISGTSATVTANVNAASVGTATITIAGIDPTELARQAKIDTLLATLLAEDDPSDGSLWNSETSTEYKWSYINGCMITAFMDLYDITGEEKYLTVSDTYQSGFVNSDGTVAGTRTSAVKTSTDLDDVNPGKSLLDLIEAGSSNSAKYESCVTGQLSAILNRVSRVENTLNFYHKGNYPHQVWLDGTYMALPYMIQYERVIGGTVGGNSTMEAVANDVTAQFRNVYNKMRNPETGLYYHGYDSQADSTSADVSLSTAMSWANGSAATSTPYKVSSFVSDATNKGCSASYWLRAMGWYGMALIDTYEQMTLAEQQKGIDLSTQKAEIAYIFTDLMDSVLNYQDSSGLWYQVVDNPQDEANKGYNYLETSGSAAFAAALMKGYNLGVLTDEAKYYNAGLKAFNELTDSKLNTTGGLEEICGTAGLGGVTTAGKATGHTSSSATRGPAYNYRDGSYDYYVSEKLATNDAKGAAPYLMAYAQKLLHDKNS